MEGRRYLEKTVEVTESDNPYSLQEKISSVVARDGARSILTAYTLTGERDPGFVPQVREYLKCGRILSVTDQTVPAFHLDVLRKKYEGKLIGRFINRSERGRTDRCDRRKSAVLWTGSAAVSGRTAREETRKKGEKQWRLKDWI